MNENLQKYVLPTLSDLLKSRVATLCPYYTGPFDVLDDLLARALCCLSHRPLLSGDDEPETLSYQIVLFGPIGADVRQSRAG